MAKTYTVRATLNTYGCAQMQGNWFDNAYGGQTYAARVGRNSDYYLRVELAFDLSGINKSLITAASLTLAISATGPSTRNTQILVYSGASGVTSGSILAANTFTANSTSVSYSGLGSAVAGSSGTFVLVPSESSTSIIALTYNSQWADISSATLTITTSETDYTLSYNANGGSGAPGSQTKTGVGSASYTISSTVPTRTGYSFLGWSTASTATTASYQAGGSITISANTTLYAVWAAWTYAVTYNANGGSGAPDDQIKTHDVTLTLSSTTPTRAGYAFARWNTAANGTGTSYASGGSYTANTAVTLYAQWEVQSIVRVKGVDGQLHDGIVYVKGVDDRMHIGVVHVKGADGQLHVNG